MTPEEIRARLLEATRELARRSLYEFVRMAWQHCDPSPFRDGWHIRALCQVLEEISDGKRKRTVINIPPGTGKSLITGVFWPVWDWLHKNPARAWMFASFDSSLLNGKSTVLINLVQSPWFVAHWGSLLPPGKPNTSEIKTLRKGVKFNTSFGGRGTGRHCDIQVIDDPIKPRDASGGAAITGVVLESTIATIKNTFASRAKDPNTFARVMIMQRIHESDPSAWALAEGWDHVCFPMRLELETKDALDERTEEGEILAPDRFEPEAVDALEHSVGPDVWATQYQQRPAAPGGAIVKDEWIDLYACTLAEANAQRGQTIQSWDLAFKDAESSDFVCGMHWTVTWSDKGVPHYWLRALINDRLSFVATCNAIIGARAAWPSGEILIEDKANGAACENTLRTMMPGVIKLVNPQGSKVSRFHAIAPAFANGQVHLPRDAPWFDALRSTLLRFPRVRRDDQVDALSQAVLYLSESSLIQAAMAAIRK